MLSLKVADIEGTYENERVKNWSICIWPMTKHASNVVWMSSINQIGEEAGLLIKTS